MMYQIYKYSLIYPGEMSVVLPFNAQILTVQNQDGVLQLWAKSDIDTERTERRELLITGTGHNIYRKNLEYIATVQMDKLVWHIFEIIR